MRRAPDIGLDAEPRGLPFAVDNAHERGLSSGAFEDRDRALIAEERGCWLARDRKRLDLSANFTREAEILFRQTLEITKQALGDKHPDHARSLKNLALLYVARGDHAKAEPLARQALEILRDSLDLAAASQSERQLTYVAHLAVYS